MEQILLKQKRKVDSRGRILLPLSFTEKESEEFYVSLVKNGNTEYIKIERVKE